MKFAKIAVLSILGILQCASCAPKITFTVGSDVALKDISEFCYTDSRIDFDACYQRYRFYTENGEYFFSHETRERPDDYGPTTEEDITAIGTLALTREEWEQFFTYLKDGEVRKMTGEEESSTGYIGPRIFLYWAKDSSVYQVYTFPSLERRGEFLEYCAALALKTGQPDS